MKKLREMIFIVFMILPLFADGNAFAEEPLKININGYISQGFLLSSGNNFLAETRKGTFQFNEMGINFTTGFLDKIHLGIQFAARDLGDVGNDKVQIDWAYADYQFFDWFGLRAGKMKLPIGFYNKTRDIDMLRTFILLPQSVYTDNFRDMCTAMKGIGIYGVISLHRAGNVSYQASLGTTEIDREGSSSKVVNATGFFDVDKYNVGMSYNGSLIWETPIKGLRTGVTITGSKIKYNGSVTKDLVIPIPTPPYTMTIAQKGDMFKGEIPLLLLKTFSAEYTMNNLVVAAEYLRFRQEARINMPTGYSLDMNKSNNENYYVSASYRFADWFEFGSYYSVCYLDRKDKKGKNFNPPYSAYQKDWCATLRFDVNQRTTFKLEGHLMNGAGSCFPQDNFNAIGIPQYAKNWVLFAAKMTYNF
ncbi:MAG: porin [Candidatus Omnitrophota bacterium]